MPPKKARRVAAPVAAPTPAEPSASSGDDTPPRRQSRRGGRRKPAVATRPAAAPREVTEVSSDSEVVIVERSSVVAHAVVTEEEPCHICSEPYGRKRKLHCASCQQHMHQTCLTRWGRTPANRNRVRDVPCPFCRRGFRTGCDAAEMVQAAEVSDDDSPVHDHDILRDRLMARGDGDLYDVIRAIVQGQLRGRGPVQQSDTESSYSREEGYADTDFSYSTEYTHFTEDTQFSDRLFTQFSDIGRRVEGSEDRSSLTGSLFSQTVVEGRHWSNSQTSVSSLDGRGDEFRPEYSSIDSSASIAPSLPRGRGRGGRGRGGRARGSARGRGRGAAAPLPPPNRGRGNRPPQNARRRGRGGTR
jgi:hypothetical protein